MTQREPVELKLQLSEEDYRTLERMAAQQGRSLSETTRRAIIHDNYFRERERHGEKVLIYKRDKSFREIILK